MGKVKKSVNRTVESERKNQDNYFVKAPTPESDNGRGGGTGKNRGCDKRDSSLLNEEQMITKNYGERISLYSKCVETW